MYHQQGHQNLKAGEAEAARARHMEDEDEMSSRTSSQQMLNNNTSIASLLYCDEDPVVSTTPPPLPPLPWLAMVPPQQQQSPLLATVGDVEEHLVDYMAKERFYAPTCRGSYLEHLMPPLPAPPPQQQGPTPPEAIIPGSVSGARSRGVHYIIYAFGRLGLTVATLFNAVNYLDRFLSINCHLWWEAWMVELVSVACLSIACKLDEVNIPSLHHLQMDEVMSHSFLPATVLDMELTLLKALQWRLACVTPYSFLHLLLAPPRAHTTAAAAAWTTTSHRCTRLLIRSLAEPRFIQFDSSVVASSAVRCVALEDRISRLIRPDCPAIAMDEGDDADECFRMMKTLYDTSCCSESDSNGNTHHQQQLYSSHERLRMMSPVSSVMSGRLINSSRSAVSRCRLLFGSSAPQTGTTQLQSQDDDDTTTHVRDEDISHI